MINAPQTDRPRAVMGDTCDRSRVTLTRPVVSQSDGMREGALMVPILFILGFVGASFVHPAALTSFWVWVGLLAMTVGVSVAVQRAFATLYGHREDGTS